jgi:hypothetical protein
VKRLLRWVLVNDTHEELLEVHRQAQQVRAEQADREGWSPARWLRETAADYRRIADDLEARAGILDGGPDDDAA